MLYIIPIDDYTIKFHDNNGHGQVYGIDLEARVDSVGRIWISDKYLEKNILNSCLVSEISFWNGISYQMFDNPIDFVDAFNEATDTEVTTTTTTESLPPLNAITTKDGSEYIRTVNNGYLTTKN